MTPADPEHHLPETLRAYRYTTIYIGIAITVVLVLLLWDRFDGPAPSVCRTAAAILTGS
jgi:hypothetical protein